MSDRTRELLGVSNPDVLTAVRPLTVLPILKSATEAARIAALDNGGFVEDSTGSGWSVANGRHALKRGYGLTVWSKLVQVEQVLPASVTIRARTFASGRPGFWETNEDGSKKLYHEDLLDPTERMVWKRQGVSQLDLIQLGSRSGVKPYITSEPSIVTVDAINNSAQRAEELLASISTMLLAFASSDA